MEDLAEVDGDGIERMRLMISRGGRQRLEAK
jgi:hypothetical protein